MLDSASKIDDDTYIAESPLGPFSGKEITKRPRAFIDKRRSTAMTIQGAADGQVTPVSFRVTKFAGCLADNLLGIYNNPSSKYMPPQSFSIRTILPEPANMNQTAELVRVVTKKSSLRSI